MKRTESRRASHARRSQPGRTPLSRVLDRQALRRLSGSTSFARGADYAARGQVHRLVEDKDSIAAQVHGTHRYDVRLWIERGNLEYSCTCPVATDGAFCKHCAAAGIAWLDKSQEGAPAKKTAKPATTMDDAGPISKGSARRRWSIWSSVRRRRTSACAGAC